MYTAVTPFSYILPKHAKTKEPKDKHYVLPCTYIKYICDPIPLDNPKNHTVLPYITWGAYLDSQIKKEIPLEIKILGISINKFYQTAIKNFKSKRKQLHMDKPWRKKKNPSCQADCFQE